MAKSIYPGDSIEVSTFGYITKGFVLSHFMTSRTVGSDKTEVISWMLIDQNNKVVFFRPTDVFNTTRIVLTEKVKTPTKLNEEFNDKIFEAEREFKSRQWMFNSRRVGRSFSMAQSVIFDSINKQTEISGIPKGNITLIAGKSK